MPTELEGKFAVEAHEPIRSRFEQLGAEFIGAVLETNTIHDRGDGQLRKSGCGLRVRSIEVLEGKSCSATLTFKGPIQPSAFKKREELELPLADADAMRRLLDALGFIEVLRFQKRRESWQLDRCRVELDEIARLGRFVEIEGPDESQVQSARQALGLAEAEHITRGYVGLLRDSG